jgi:phospholipid/cholesterol/gamma-HCH transport system permease protein
MPSFAVRTLEDAGTETLQVSGRLTLGDAQALWNELQSGVARSNRGDEIKFDLSDLEHADGAAVAVIVGIQADLKSRGTESRIVGARPSVALLLDVYRPTSLVRGSVPGGERQRKSLLARIGRDALGLLRETQAWLTFVGATAAALVGSVRRPATGNWKVVPSLMERAGADAAPITLVMNFLIGFITAYEFGNALRRFGATVYVPDFVGLSITRELAPLMTAIVATGRTAAAFTAELGAMSVSDEIAAMRVLRIDPLRFLVVPRIIALALTLPLITVMADALGMLGGLLIAQLSFDMSAQYYFRETRNVVLLNDILFGVCKSVLFAVTMGTIACQQGLATSGGPNGVGRRTTASVVSILSAIMLIDALFAPR